MTEPASGEPADSHAIEVDERDDLPPVEPPTSGFIVQLFLLPAFIVAIVVAVWLLFGRIAGGDRKPEQYLASLADANQERRWIAAHELATLLSGSQRWKHDIGLATNLAKMLDVELSREKPDTSLQRYLVLSTAAFDLDVGVPAIIRATESATGRDSKVRAAAVWSLGLMSSRIPTVATSASVCDALVEAARDDDASIRRFAAYSLGNVNIETARTALRARLLDPDRETRYNAANALTRAGDLSGIEVVREMLLPREALAKLGLTDEQVIDVPLQAMRALEVCARRSPEADLSSLKSAIDAWASQPLEVNRLQARAVLLQLK